jgi:hypothetical protein
MSSSKRRSKNNIKERVKIIKLNGKELIVKKDIDEEEICSKINGSKKIDAFNNEQEYLKLLDKFFIENGYPEGIKDGGAKKDIKFKKVIINYSTYSDKLYQNLSDEDVDIIYNKAIKEYTAFINNYYDELDHKCICSKTIKYVQYIINLINGNILTVGNSCISKSDDENLAILLSDLSYALEKLNNHEDYRKCIDCNWFLISEKEDKKKIRCKKCYKKYKSLTQEKNSVSVNSSQSPVAGIYEVKTRSNSKTFSQMKMELEEALEIQKRKVYRICEDCREYNIPKNSEKYVTKCKNCYIQYMKLNTNNGRKCIDCYKSILDSEPSYIIRCKRCWVNYINN